MLGQPAGDTPDIRLRHPGKGADIDASHLLDRMPAGLPEDAATDERPQEQLQNDALREGARPVGKQGIDQGEVVGKGELRFRQVIDEQLTFQGLARQITKGISRQACRHTRQPRRDTRQTAGKGRDQAHGTRDLTVTL